MATSYFRCVATVEILQRQRQAVQPTNNFTLSPLQVQPPWPATAYSEQSVACLAVDAVVPRAHPSSSASATAGFTADATTQVPACRKRKAQDLMTTTDHPALQPTASGTMARLLHRWFNASWQGASRTPTCLDPFVYDNLPLTRLYLSLVCL